MPRVQMSYTVLDMDNLHFSDEFLDFLVQANADIHTDALGFSARFRLCNELYMQKWRNVSRLSHYRFTYFAVALSIVPLTC